MYSSGDMFPKHPAVCPQMMCLLLSGHADVHEWIDLKNLFVLNPFHSYIGE